MISYVKYSHYPSAYGFYCEGQRKCPVTQSVVAAHRCVKDAVTELKDGVGL